MSYHGDSPGKRLARGLTWHILLKEFGESASKKKYLMLAGPEARDVDVLLRNEIPSSQITTIDCDKKCVLSSMERHTGIHAVLADLSIKEDVLLLKENSEKFDAAFLDFCSPVGDYTLAAIQNTLAHLMRSRSKLAVNFLFGRESEEFRKVIPYEDDVCGSSRSIIVWESLIKHLPRWEIWPTHSIKYHSREEKRQGSPMLTLIFDVRHLNSPMSLEKRWRRVIPKLETIHQVVLPHGDEAWEELRRFAVETIEPSSHVASWFNIPVAKVAAWRAVETRRLKDYIASAS